MKYVDWVALVLIALFVSCAYTTGKYYDNKHPPTCVERSRE